MVRKERKERNEHTMEKVGKNRSFENYSPVHRFLLRITLLFRWKQSSWLVKSNFCCCSEWQQAIRMENRCCWKKMRFPWQMGPHRCTVVSVEISPSFIMWRWGNWCARDATIDKRAKSSSIDTAKFGCVNSAVSKVEIDMEHRQLEESAFYIFYLLS